MKNKLLKGAHLSGRKCGEILQLFCDDLTATQIAEITGVSRVTINNYFKLIRNHIAAHCEKGKTYTTGADNISDPAIGYNSDEHAYYGFSIRNDVIKTQWLKDIRAESLQQLQNTKPNATISKITFPEFEHFHAVADCAEWNLYWIGTPQNNLLNQAGLASDIGSFWQHAKGRLLKFRGMSKKTLYLHLKECEFRYNFRNDELFPVLMNIINTSSNTTNLAMMYDLVS
ncbi:MAG: hypothetical protein QM763_16815 [Agriterribacter sp.]